MSKSVLTFIADTHHYSRTLGDKGKAFTLRSDSDQKCLKETGDIIDAAFEYLGNSNSDAVCIAGDLTDDGETVCHEEFREKLYKLKEKFNSDVIVEMTLVDYKNDTHRFLGFTSYENYCNHIKRKAIKKEIRKKQVEIEKLIEELSYI